MSVEFDGISDGWEISAGFLDGDGDFEKTETTWNGRKIVIQSAGGRAGEIFQEQQIALAVIQELLQEDGLAFPLSGHDVTHLLPFEELFFDSGMDLMLAPAWDIDPNKQFVLAPAYSQDQIVRCGLRKFWKKHKTAILITAGAIVVVAGGAIAIAMLWPAAGTTAVGIGGTIASGLMNGDSSPDNSSSVPNNPHPSPGESPVNTTPPPLPSFVEAPKDFYNNTKFDPPPPPPMDLHSILPSSQQTGTSFSISNMSGINQLAFSTTSPSLPDLSPPANPFLSASPSPSGTSKPFSPGSVLQNTSPSFSSSSQPKPNFFPPLPQLSGAQGAPLPMQGGGANFLPLPNPIEKYFPPLPKLPGSPEPLVLPPPSKESDSLSGQVDSPTSIKTGVSAEYKPSRSERMPTLGMRNSDLFVLNINGINTSPEEALSHQAYLGSLVNNQAPIDFIYNRTHGAPLDLLEVFILNYSGISPNTEDLLLQSWQEFADKHKDNPHKKVLQPCHSQGAVHVYNALASASKELRDRVIVVAIAPAKVIPRDMCYESFNYASKRDIVPLGNILFVNIVEAANSNLELSDNLEMTRRNQEELILLDPAPEIKSGIDHEFQSPTFKPKLTEHLKDYINRNGEYP